MTNVDNHVSSALGTYEEGTQSSKVTCISRDTRLCAVYVQLLGGKVNGTVFLAQRLCAVYVQLLGGRRKSKLDCKVDCS